MPYLAVAEFQFHKGAIRTRTHSGTCFAGQQFQFHKGAIRTSWVKAGLCDLQNFNSIKVRLELAAEHLLSQSDEISIP
mgnify:CR=1 FL=1